MGPIKKALLVTALLAALGLGKAVSSFSPISPTKGIESLLIPEANAEPRRKWVKYVRKCKEFESKEYIMKLHGRSFDGRNFAHGEILGLSIYPKQKLEDIIVKYEIRTSPAPDFNFMINKEITIPLVQQYERVYKGLIGTDLFTEPGAYGIAVRTKLNNEWQEHQHWFVTEGRRLKFKEDVKPRQLGDRKRAALEWDRWVLFSSWSEIDKEAYWEGRFKKPVFGRCWGYGTRPKPKELDDGTRYLHRAFDCGGKEGDPIWAPNYGIVTLAKEGHPKLGNAVVINHGLGLHTIYGHLSRIDVCKDYFVTKSEKIGEIGSTGKAGGDHLHYVVKLYTLNVNPASLDVLHFDGTRSFEMRLLLNNR